MIFRLTHSLEHTENYEDFDAVLFPFDNSGGINYEIPDFPYDQYAPEIMEFEGHLQKLALTDFPRTNPTMPLMSMKMLLACLSAGVFPYEAHPTRIYASEGTDTQQVNDSFVNVHLTTWTDALDMRRTLLARRDPRQPRAARKYLTYPAQDADDPTNLDLEAIEVLRLKGREDELPGIFRMQQVYGLYCPEKTKIACEQAGVRGVEFTPVPVPLGQGERPYLSGFRLVAEADLAAL